MVEAPLADVARRLDLGAGLTVTPIAAGISNRTVVLGGRDKQVLVRQWSGERRGDHLPRELEVSLWRAAAVRGIAPQVLFADLDAGIVASEYLADSRAWTSVDAQMPANWTKLGRLLARFNNLDHPLPRYSPLRSARQYIDTMARLGLSAQQRSWAKELVTLAEGYERRFAATVVCHHDLLPANILETANGALKLIDFEYAGRGHPIFDWATLAAFGGFAERGQIELAGRALRTESAAELQVVVRLVRLLAYYWAQNELIYQPACNDLLTLRDDLTASLEQASS